MVEPIKNAKTIYFGKKVYRIISPKSSKEVKIKHAYYVPPQLHNKLNRLSVGRLVRIIKGLNSSIIDLHIDYERMCNSYAKFTVKHKTSYSIEEINGFIDELLTPSQGESGCSEFEYLVRKENYKIDKTNCNSIRCKYWFDNEKWSNCAKLAMGESHENEGLTLEKMGNISNFLGKGKVSRERIRQIEVEAVKSFIEKIKKDEDLSYLARNIVVLGRGKEGNKDGLFSESDVRNNTKKSILNRRKS